MYPTVYSLSYTVVGAALVPYIDLMVAVTGSLVGAFLSFSLPAMIHAVSLTWDANDGGAAENKGTGTGENKNGRSTTKNGEGATPIRTCAALTVDVVLLVVGVIACVVGTYTVVGSIIRAKQKT